MDSVRSSSFEVETYIKGYHAYEDIWVHEINEKLQARMEPENLRAQICGLRTKRRQPRKQYVFQLYI